jgi:hypothetical protein
MAEGDGLRRERCHTVRLFAQQIPIGANVPFESSK